MCAIKWQLTQQQQHTKKNNAYIYNNLGYGPWSEITKILREGISCILRYYYNFLMFEEKEEEEDFSLLTLINLINFFVNIFNF